MTNPYCIDGPAVVSFSGGRTSGYMLRQILDAGLRPDVHVLFANTGREREETLQFVHECETNWHIPVVWLEFVAAPDVSSRWRAVTFDTASRNGEPFEALITVKRFLPNPVSRFCTQELKIRPMKSFMLSQGYEHWTNIVGLRADEPRRVAKMRGQDQVGRPERWDVALPLADAGVSKPDVLAYWKQQPFDLQLREHEGNCDLCFLKGYDKIRNIVRERPDLAKWWSLQEVRIGATFRNDRPSYSAMLAQRDLFQDGAFDTLAECYCTD